MKLGNYSPGCPEHVRWLQKLCDAYLPWGGLQEVNASGKTLSRFSLIQDARVALECKFQCSILWICLGYIKCKLIVRYLTMCSGQKLCRPQRAGLVSSIRQYQQCPASSKDVVEGDFSFEKAILV